VDSFEKDLKQKLSQKASGVTSEEQVLMKSFKYFDLDNSGQVEPEEFAKAIEKIGIIIPTKAVRILLCSSLRTWMHFSSCTM
jgi:Ca2+-binding EF-hand superfamily protein